MKAFHGTLATLAFGALVAAGCTPDQRDTVDSAAGAAAADVRAALSIINIDVGRRVDAERKIIDETDEFAPTDTIYASVLTSGVAVDDTVTGRWTSADGSVLHEETVSVTSDGGARLVFFVARPAGFEKGKYTLHILVDGNEARSKDVTVK